MKAFCLCLYIMNQISPLPSSFRFFVSGNALTVKWKVFLVPRSPTSSGKFRISFRREGIRLEIIEEHQSESISRLGMNSPKELKIFSSAFCLFALRSTQMKTIRSDLNFFPASRSSSEDPFFLGSLWLLKQIKYECLNPLCVEARDGVINKHWTLLIASHFNFAKHGDHALIHFSSRAAFFILAQQKNYFTIFSFLFHVVWDSRDGPAAALAAVAGWVEDEIIWK